MSDLKFSPQEKNAGDRKFYVLPEEYRSCNFCVSEESRTLLSEVYSSICSRDAKFDGPYGKRSGKFIKL